MLKNLRKHRQFHDKIVQRGENQTGRGLGRVKRWKSEDTINCFRNIDPLFVSPQKVCKKRKKLYVLGSVDAAVTCFHQVLISKKV